MFASGHSEVVKEAGDFEGTKSTPLERRRLIFSWCSASARSVFECEDGNGARDFESDTRKAAFTSNQLH